MATTATPEALRALADLIETAGVRAPQMYGLYFNIGFMSEGQRDAFRVLRALPGAMLTNENNLTLVTVTVPVVDTTIDFKFSQSALGSMRTVTREVVEFVLDPELLDEPVAS